MTPEEREATLLENLGPLVCLGANAEEEEAVEAITHAIDSLDQFVADFAADVGLFEESYAISENLSSRRHVATMNGDFSEASRLQDLRATFAKRKFIAARDGAMQIYHFCFVTKLIRENLPRVPLLDKLVDAAGRESLGERIEAAFPSYKDIRNAVGHSRSELVLDDGKRRHEPKPTQIEGFAVGNGLIIDGSLKENKYIATIKGRTGSYEISSASTAILAEFLEQHRKLFTAAILSVTPEMKRAYAERLRLAKP